MAVPVRRRWVWLLGFAILAFLGAPGQLPATDDTPKNTDDIFLQTPLLALPTWEGRPFIKVRVNDSDPLLLLVDTGADAALALDKIVASTITAYRGAKKRQASLKGNRNDTVEAADISLQIGKAYVPKATTVAFDFPSFFPFDGILGFEFLKHFTATFDWKAGQFVLSTSRQQPQKAKGIKLVEHFLYRDKPVIRGTVNGIETEFLLDTGTLHTFIPHHLVKQLTFKRLISGKFLLSGSGSYETDCRLGRIQSITIGDEQMVNTVVQFAVDKQAYSAIEYLGREIGVLGGDVFQKFRVTIDGPASLAYFERVDPEIKGEFDEASVGILLRLRGKKVIVAQVYDPSPASRVGVTQRDEILEVNGQPIEDNVEKSLQQLRGEEGEKVSLVVLRNGKRIKFEMTREKIL